MVNKIDSNSVGLAIAEEVIGSPKTLPGTPIWRSLLPNDYGDFGVKTKQVARDPITSDRQKRRSVITDVDASASFPIDLTQEGLNRLWRGALFSTFYEKADTAPIDGTAITITSATSTTYTAASGLTVFNANDLIYASGFTNAANNGLKLLSASASGSVTTTGNVSEASPPAASRLQKVGYQFASGDATMTVTSGVATLGATAKDLTTLGLNVGEWIFIGGDAAGSFFGTCPTGYARILSISATAIVFDKVTAAFVTDTGSGKTIRIFFGKFLKNEQNSANIITRLYQLERQLGNDGSGIQSEYIRGAVVNEVGLTIPQGDKITADFNFVATDGEYRTGSQGVKSGTRVADLNEKAFNSSSHVYRFKMNIIDATTLQPSALFAYILSGSLSIKNNASLSKAVGVTGGFDINVGSLDVSGELNPYFTNTSAISSIRNNPDVTIDLILTQSNAGLILDLPLISLSTGAIEVKKDDSIKMKLNHMACTGANGYTVSYTNFAYLPTAAMSS